MNFCPRCGTVAGRPADTACARCGAALARPQVDRPEPPAVRAPTNRGEALQRAAGVRAESLPKAPSRRTSALVAQGASGAAGAVSEAEADQRGFAGVDTGKARPAWGLPVGEPRSVVAEGQTAVAATTPVPETSAAWPPPPRQWPAAGPSPAPTEPPPTFPPYSPSGARRGAPGGVPEAPAGRRWAVGVETLSRRSTALRARLAGPDRRSWMATRGEPPNYFWVSLLSIFLFLPTGVAASVFSLLCTSRARRGDMDGSWRASRLARGFCIATVPLFALATITVALGGVR